MHRDLSLSSCITCLSCSEKKEKVIDFSLTAVAAYVPTEDNSSHRLSDCDCENWDAEHNDRNSKSSQQSLFPQRQLGGRWGNALTSLGCICNSLYSRPLFRCCVTIVVSKKNHRRPFGVYTNGLFHTCKSKKWFFKASIDLRKKMLKSSVRIWGGGLQFKYSFKKSWCNCVGFPE